MSQALVGSQQPLLQLVSGWTKEPPASRTLIVQSLFFEQTAYLQELGTQQNSGLA